MSARILPWLLCYDVRCKRRLYKVHRWMLYWAAPVQYSVFLGYFRDATLERLLNQAESELLKPADDLRAYPVAERSSVMLTGRPRCPEDWDGLARLTRRHGEGG